MAIHFVDFPVKNGDARPGTFSFTGRKWWERSTWIQRFNHGETRLFEGHLAGFFPVDFPAMSLGI
jgi:hypothetical protein